jgi:hypothetical protein
MGCYCLGSHHVKVVTFAVCLKSGGDRNGDIRMGEKREYRKICASKSLDSKPNDRVRAAFDVDRIYKADVLGLSRHHQRMGALA